MYSIPPQFHVEAETTPSVADSLRSLLQRLDAASTDPLTAEAVLEMADAYEAEQPSFAADLRAAADAAIAG